MRIYIASFFDTRERLLPIRDAILTMGHSCTSNWLDEPSTQPQELARDQWWERLALRDLRDVAGSDLLILDTLDETPRGGREVEYGYSLMACDKVWRVGPARNVFHALADQHYSTWEEALVALHPAG